MKMASGRRRRLSFLLHALLAALALLWMIPVFWLLPVSYTHLDVYKRQPQAGVSMDKNAFAVRIF